MGAVAFVWGLSYLNTWLSPTTPWIGRLLSRWQDVSAAAYNSLLVSIVEVSGVFLGLYFTALSVVASTAYEDVPRRVRTEVLTARASNLYIYCLAFVTATGLLLLAASSIGWETGLLNFVAIVLLAVLAVFSFVRLGRSVFQFFDPTVLTGQLIGRIYRAMRSATVEGFSAADPSFQNYYRQKAEETVKTLDVVADLAVESDSVSNEQLRDFAQKVLALLVESGRERAQIPPGSLWFKKREKYPSWLTSDYHRIEIALQTSTSLPFETPLDQYWLENRLGQTLETVLRSLLKNRAVLEAAEIGLDCQNAIEELATNFRLEEALRLHRILLPLAREEAGFERQPDLETPEGQETQKYRHGAVDALAGGLRSIAVGLMKGSRELSADVVKSLAHQQAHRSPDEPVGRTIPDQVRDRVLDLRRRLQFENAAEGQQITPDWYSEDYIGQSFALFFQDASERLVEELEKTYLKTGQVLLVEGPQTFVPRIVNVGLESCEKTARTLDHFRYNLEELEALRSEAAETDWPRTSVGEVWSVRDKLIELLGRSVPHLNLDIPVGPLPDDPGFTYTFIADECYQALHRGSDELFAKLFPPLFQLGASLFERLNRELEGSNARAWMIYQSDIALDILTLSGYGLLFGQLDDRETWETVESTWDTYLGGVSQPENVLRSWVGFFEYRRTAFQMSPRETRRHSWFQAFQDRMQEEGYSEGRLVSSYSPRGSDNLRQEPLSRVARVVLNGFHHEPSDAFVFSYLLRRPEASGLSTPETVEGFADSFARTAGSIDLISQPTLS